tara:strand:- start:178 stop:309 length:132 start_codon:yes stop_codon:yes gene_type:complete
MKYDLLNQIATKAENKMKNNKLEVGNDTDRIASDTLKINNEDM